MDIQLTIKDEKNNPGESTIVYDEKVAYDNEANSHTFFCETSYSDHTIMVRGGYDEQSIQVLVIVDDEQKLMYIGQMGHKNSSFVINIAPKRHLCITLL